MKKYLMGLFPVASIGITYLLCWMYTFVPPTSVAWWFRLTTIWLYILAFLCFVNTCVMAIGWFFNLSKGTQIVAEPIEKEEEKIP